MTFRDQLQATLAGTHTLERELGGGGMSLVWLAEETRLKRKVVVKVLSPELAQGISVERFEREIQTVAQLQQANIVPVITSGDTNGLPYYTMPFVEGESLRARVARGPLPVADVIGIMRDVSKALGYAHKHGVVHRDIKPDNVMISGGTAVVTDFGIAKAISDSRESSSTSTRSESLTQLGTSIGTPAYMAPEQAAGDPGVDHRADIYSLGCMIYELLAGQSPFAGRSPQRMLAAHMSEMPKPIGEVRPEIAPAFADLITQCLAKEPADRPQSAHDIAQILDGIATGTGVHSGSMLSAGRISNGRALAIYAGAVAVVALFAKAAIVGIGLPDWVFPGAMIVMALTLALKALPRMTWGKVARFGSYAIGAFTVVVGAFMVMRALGIGPVGSLIASGDFKERDRVIITDFTVSNGDSALGRVVSDAIRAGLADSRVFTLVTPVEIAASLQRMQRPATTRINLETARQIALRDGVKAIIDGDVTMIGTSYIVATRLVTADSGRELASYRGTASSSDAIIGVADDLSRKLRGKAGESLKRVQGTPALAYASTSSLEALRKYSDGARANDVERDYMKSIALLREAVALDSNFAEGWRKLSVAIRNSGRFPPSASDSAIRKAFALAGRMTERERDAVLASYWGGTPGNDRAKAIATYERMLARGDSVLALNNVAIQYSSRQEYARSESLYRASIRVNPTAATSYSNLLNVFASQSKYKERDSLLAVAMERFPAITTFKQAKLNYLFDQSRVEDGLKALDSAIKDPDPRNPAWATARLGQARLADGHVREWQTLSLKARDMVRTGPPQPGVFRAAEVLSTRIDLGMPYEAELKTFDAELAKFNIDSLPVLDRPYFYLASVQAVTGRADRAKALVAKFDAAVRDTAMRRWQANGILEAQANIAYAEKRWTDAIRLAREASRRPDGPVNGCIECVPLALMRLFAEAGMVDSALYYHDIYKKTPVGSRPREGPDYRIGAPMIERLAKMYDTKGDTANAVLQYNEFIQMWKDADPELQPRVAAARERVKKLTPVEGRRP
jgi:tRNA A-37 threonylcarbamoyl transferase component Bud32/tetratricopeptide (TPR) repeat protein